MTRTADLLYGAFELKSRYQRNMMMGTLTATLVATVIVSSVWIYSNYFLQETISVVPPRPPAGFADTLIIIPPSLPTDPGDLPGGKGGIVPPPPPEFNGGLIEIIDDSSSEVENEFPFPGKGPDYRIYDPARNPDQTGGGGFNGSDPGGVYIPEPGKFIPHEVEPVLVHEELPDYPRIPQEAGFTGWVVIQAFVDRSGDVLKAEAVRCNRPNMGFEEAAIEAALKCKYRPAIQNGDPIGVWIAYKVEFKF